MGCPLVNHFDVKVHFMMFCHANVNGLLSRVWGDVWISLVCEIWNIGTSGSLRMRELII